MDKHVLVTLIYIIVRGKAVENRGSFWHLTDVHYDPWYGKSLGISCNEEISQQGRYGDFECDSPWSLVQASIQGMKGLEQQTPAFILWSGDNAPHVANKSLLSLVNNEIIIELTQNITELILETFPNILVLPMVGNHDYYPKNQLPGESNVLYDAYADMWSTWLNETHIQTTFRRGAYYSRLIGHNPDIRAVILNTNLYYRSNGVTANQEDPGGQLEWLEQLMENARDNGEKVHIFTHVPPGVIGTNVQQFTPAFNKKFIALVVKYSDAILSTHGVHTHQDVFKLFYDDNGQPVSSMFISPSVTPWRVPLGTFKTPPHNPAFRKYYFDESTFELLDYEQFSLELTKANEDETTDWKLLYSFTTLYDVTSLHHNDLAGLLEEFKEDDSEKFSRFYDTVYVNTYEEGYVGCNCECKSAHLCAIEFVDYDEYDGCLSKLPYCGGPVEGGARGMLSLLALKEYHLFSAYFIVVSCFYKFHKAIFH